MEDFFFRRLIFYIICIAVKWKLIVSFVDRK